MNALPVCHAQEPTHNVGHSYSTIVLRLETAPYLPRPWPPPARYVRTSTNGLFPTVPENCPVGPEEQL